MRLDIKKDFDSVLLANCL